jgi:ATP-binding cassette, subfamily B, multidrug efflux pump
MTIMTFSRSEASSRRILEVLNMPADITDSVSAVQNNPSIKKGSVEFQNVFFKYHPDSDEYVLKNISFTAEAGQNIAIIGATGSAKSTLVQLIPRLYEATKGRILVDGRNVSDYTMLKLRTGISMVLQQNELFSGTIQQNLRWGDIHATDDAVIAAAKDAQAHDFIMSFPNQYETVLGQGGVNLSGGQKQRLCIARAILRKPAILILDDSTSAVDMATEAKINHSLSSHLPGTTIFIIAQRINSILGADKIILVDQGEITGSGTHPELMKTSAVYQEIYNSQQLKEMPAN